MVAREERILRPRGEQNYAEVNSNEEAQVEVTDSHIDAVQQVQEAQRLNDERELYVLQRIEEYRENIRRRQERIQWEQEHQKDRDLQFAEAMVYDEDSLPENNDDNSCDNSSHISAAPDVPATAMTSFGAPVNSTITPIAQSDFEKFVVEKVERRLRQRPVVPLSPKYQHRADVNKKFQS